MSVSLARDDAALHFEAMQGALISLSSSPRHYGHSLDLPAAREIYERDLVEAFRVCRERFPAWSCRDFLDRYVGSFAFWGDAVDAVEGLEDYPECFEVLGDRPFWDIYQIADIPCFVPEDGDYVISTCGALGGRYHVGVVGGGSRGFHAESVEWSDILDAIHDDMERNNFYSEIWFEDDHGGISPVVDM